MNKEDLEQFRKDCRDMAAQTSGINKDLYRGSEDAEETGNEDIDGHHENGIQKPQAAEESPENTCSKVISIKARRRRA